MTLWETRKKLCSWQEINLVFCGGVFFGFVFVFLPEKIDTKGASINSLDSFRKLRQNPKQHKNWNGYNFFKTKIKAAQLLVKGTSCDLA